MAITITREVREVNITVTRNGKTVVIQPTISKNGGFDGNINGGTP